MNSEKNEFKFNSDYIDWKKWDKNEGFGVVNKTQSSYFANELKRTKVDFKENSRVLEIGFGNGSFLKYSRIKKWKIFGIELNDRLVEMADSQGYNVKCTDNLKSFKNDYFDLIVAFDVLEHINQDELIEFMSQVKYKLKKGGVFIARFPNGDSPFGMRNQNGDITHLTTIGSGKIQYLANKSELEIISLRGEAQPLLGVNFIIFIHRLIAIPVKLILNFFVNSVYSPRSRIDFAAANIVCILKK